MITLSQAVHAILIPFVLSAILAALGRWRRWRWMMPAAVGTAFLVGYGLLEVPRLPPTDGTDWLFWLAIPATGLAIVDSIFLPEWGWAFGAAAGIVAGVIIYQVVPNAASPAVCWGTAIGVAAVGAGVCLAARAVEPRIGTWAVATGLCAAVGGASVVVLASDSASIGIRGLACAAALAPLVPLTVRGNHGARSVSIIAITVLAGILTGGHFYAGVTWTQFAVLMFSPALLLAGFAVPGKRRRLAGLVAAIAVIAAVVPVVVPAVIAAKHAAESNANDGYGY
jgi:hypothetical protein